MTTPTGICTVPLNIAFTDTNYWVTGVFYSPNLAETANARTAYHATVPYTVSSFQIGTYSGTNRIINFIAIGT